MVIWFVQNILLSEGYANNLEKKSKQRRGKKKKEGHRKVNFAGETIANNSADVYWTFILQFFFEDGFKGGP